MKRSVSGSTVLFSFSLAIGCANANSVYRRLNVGDGTGALIDIKQRAIVAAPVSANGRRVVVCAEPSPDALSAYAAEISAKADLPNGVAGQLATAFQESSSFTGLRTQSIQLLRDSQFRVCEAFMNGALSAEQYDLLARRYQKHTVALLAIEQLTGAMRAPSVTINTNGSAEAARSLSEIQSALAKTDKDLAAAQAQKADTALADDKKKAAEAEIVRLSANKEALTKALESSRGVLASGSATATVSVVALPEQRSDAHIETITGAVKEIVTSILDTDDLGQLCFSYLRQDQAHPSAVAKDLQKVCADSFLLAQQVKRQRLDVLKARTDLLKTAAADPATKLQELKDMSRELEDLLKDPGLKMLGKQPDLPWPPKPTEG